MLTLYSMQRSGNCYKVRLALAQTQVLPTSLVEIDILQAAKHARPISSPGIRAATCPCSKPRPGAFSPGQARHPVVPRRRLRPRGAGKHIDRAETLQWMFFEQHSLEPCLGAAHFWLALVKGGRDLQMHAIEEWMEHGYEALGVMEKHLETHPFFAADRYTIADIALYAYTHVANECGFDLTGFPAVRAWLKRIAGQPGHIRMDWHPAAMAIAE